MFSTSWEQRATVSLSFFTVQNATLARQQGERASQCPARSRLLAKFVVKKVMVMEGSCDKIPLMKEAK